MSGGEIAALPAVVLIPAAAVVAGAGLAATLALRAAQAGTEATGRALERFGDEMERTADHQDRLEVRTRLWELAAGSAVRTNQELLLLSARAAQAGVRVSLPRPLDLSDCRLVDTRSLVTQAQHALAEAREEVERAEALREQRSVLAKLPVGSSPSVSELLASYQGVLARRRQGRDAQVKPPRRVDADRVRARIDEILLRLDLDATSAEREDALLAAGLAARQKSSAASHTFLDALARIVDQVINPRAERRREAAGLLAALEHPVVTEMIGDTAPPRPPHLGSIERLRAVVHGAADLTDEDRRDARDAIGWAQRELERRRLMAAVAQAFGELGYAVTTGLGVHHTGTLSVTREGWQQGHCADVWIDDTGRVHSRLVRLAPDAPGEADRCADLNRTMRLVGAELTHLGIETQVQVPDAPVRALRRYTGDPTAQTSPVDQAQPGKRTIDPTEVNQ